MASLFYSFHEAANRLNVSKRTIHNYIKKGLLTRSFQNGQIVLKKQEVELLVESTGADLPPINRQTFFMLMTKVQTLEKTVGVLQRALEIRDIPLRPSKEQAIQLFTAASQSLAIGHWSDEEIEKWAGVFDRIDEETLGIISQATGSLTSYETLFSLCRAQLRDISTRRGFDSNLDLQLLYRKLDIGRSKFREIILVWLKTGREILPEAVLERLDDGKNAFFDKLLNGSRGRRAKENTPLG